MRDVELHYIEEGKGEPLILLLRGQGDFRSWEPLMEAFPKQYRVLSYSRRYHHPNDNPLSAQNYSVYVEADDIAAFIPKLKLGPAHLVGTSYGAFTALVLALKYPEMVRRIVLAEPPIHPRARNAPNGATLYSEFMTTIHEPVAKDFQAGDDEGALRILVDGIAGARRFDSPPGVVPPSYRTPATSKPSLFLPILSRTYPSTRKNG